MPSLTTHDHALVFICQHAAEHLTGDGMQLIRRTADHLTKTMEISTDTAMDIAGQAYAEHAARGRRESIDMSRTTSHCVFINLPNGHRRCITARALAEMIQ